jgi:hypothetical protein
MFSNKNESFFFFKLVIINFSLQNTIKSKHDEAKISNYSQFLAYWRDFIHYKLMKY